ncbi:MAG: hypothetical protein KGR69_09625 [Verrucomicrobia bacterium]|jgi:hypothetical protein|nr:hypothetical protein [Verrucomicrobiota bacterium]
MNPWHFLVVLGVTALLTSCTDPKKGGTGGAGSGAATGDSLGTTGFLATNYAPLAKWLDERFEVDYKHMTPALIFDQVPLNDIYYQTSNLPANGAPFNFSSKDISRRELLKRIASHWNLRMSLATDASGNPSAVKVEG